MLCSGRMVTGSTIMPASLRFTLSTSSVWVSIGRFLWMTPTPPSWATAMARRVSGTVSIAAPRVGMFNGTRRHTTVLRSTWLGCNSDRPGTIDTSSNVSARRSSTAGPAKLASASGSRAALAAASAVSAFQAISVIPVISAAQPSAKRGRGAMALLVLLPRAAGAGGVAPDLALAVDHLLRPARSAAHAAIAGLRRGRKLDARRRPLLAPALLEQLLLRHRLVAEELLDHVVLDPVLHRLEQLEALALVFLQRVALAVAAQADALLQVIEGEQVVLPGDVDGVQHDGALEGTDDLARVARLALRVALLERLAEGFAQPVDAEIFEVDAELVDRDVEERQELGAQAGEVPLLRVGLLRAVALDQRVENAAGHFHHVVAPLAPLEDVAAQLVDGLALLVHHVVVLEQMLAHLEVAPFDLLLGALDGLGDQRVLDRLAVGHAQAAHQALDAVGAEDPHQVVLEREIEARGAGVALAAGAAAQLVVDAPRLVALGAEDVQAAGGEHLLALLGPHFLVARERRLEGLGLLLRIGLGSRQALGIAAEHDVGAAARHVGGDGDGALASGLGDDRGLTLVVLGVEHDVRHPRRPVEQLRQHLALLDGHRAHQHRLAALVAVADLVHHRVPLLVGRAVDQVRAVFADHRLVGGDDGDVEVVDLPELGGLGVGGAGHARQLLVHPEVVLEGDRRERLVLALDLDPLLRLHRLVQPVGPAPARHHAAGELVDDDHLAVLDQVVDVELVEVVGAQRLVDPVQGLHVVRVVEVAHAEQAFDFLDPLVGQADGMALLVDQKVAGGALAAVALVDLLAARQARHDAVDAVVLVDRLLGGAGDDQRRARLVDEDRVHLVDDAVVVAALHHRLEVELHVVAQVVEAELVVGAVGDVGAIGGLALGVAEVVLDHAHGQPEEAVDAPHPVGVAAGEIVVDGDDVDALAGQGIEVDRQGRHQGLAFAGLHLGDAAAMQDDAAHQLHVEGAHVEGAPGGLAGHGEGRDQKIVEGFAGFEPPLAFLGLGAQLGVGEGLGLGLQVVDGLDQRQQLLDVAFVLAAEDLGQGPVDHLSLDSRSYPR